MTIAAEAKLLGLETGREEGVCVALGEAVINKMTPDKSIIKKEGGREGRKEGWRSGWREEGKKEGWKERRRERSIGELGLPPRSSDLTWMYPST